MPNTVNIVQMFAGFLEINFRQEPYTDISSPHVN